MRCKACDKMLQEWELAYTDRETGEHLDLCGDCLSHSNKALSDAEAMVDIETDIGYNRDEELFFEYVEEKTLDDI
jgi:hypothetical protein